MTQHAYCTKHDALDWVSGGAIRSEARLVAAVDTSTNTFTLDSHALKTGRQLLFRLEADGEMPAPLVEATPYYAIEVTDSTFQVTATADGAAIDLTTEGSNVSMIRSVPWQEYIWDAAAEIDDDLIANAPVADGPVPQIVRMHAAALVIERALIFSGGTTEDIAERLQRVHDRFERWRAGKPLRVDAPAATLKAVRTPRTSGSARSDLRGWTRHNCQGQEVLP